MCGGILYIMEEILVKNMVIGKQYEMCENYKKFIVFKLPETIKGSLSKTKISNFELELLKNQN